MIDNPLEQQTLEQYDNLYINEKFEEHCTDAAKELAKDNNLNPDYYDAFIEFYIEECRESDRGYFFSDDKYIIECWWDHNKDLYETKTPYMEIKKFISKVDGAEFEYKFNGINLEIRSEGCDWSDFIPEDKRSYSDKEYEELITLLKKEKND